MVEVREARYFIAVAEELHFGRAADRLHMSQPPLSQSVKHLERRLGVTLLTRTTREVSLTSAGAVFLDSCRLVVQAADAADVAAQTAAEGQAGRLRIGAVTSAFRELLPAALDHFFAVHPRVDVRVEEVDTQVGVQAVLRRELDVALVRQLAVPAGCVRTVLRTEAFVLAVPEAWVARLTGKGDALRAAADVPWVWIPRTIAPDYHDQVVAHCRAAGFAPDSRHTAQSITSQLVMVACGLGVALVPESATVEPRSTEGAISLLPVRRSATIDLSAVSLRGPHRLVDELLVSVRAV